MKTILRGNIGFVYLFILYSLIFDTKISSKLYLRIFSQFFLKKIGIQYAQPIESDNHRFHKFDI